MTERSPRVLYVRTEGRGAEPRATRRARELAGSVPRRVLVEEAFGFDLLGESDIRALTGWRGRMLRAVPMPLALAAEALRRSPDYDVVLTWAERFTVAVAGALLLRPRRRRPRHVAILDWVSKPVVRIPLWLVRRGVDRVLTWSSVQGAVCVDRIGFRPDQVQRIEHPVDENFFAPLDATRVQVMSAGETQRDFPTLIRAVDGSDIVTTIAAGRIGAFGGFRTRLRSAEDLLTAPPGVTVGPLSPVELRAAYAAAYAVVVPLVEAENNAGISVVLEAMAMGRPVIVTRTVGQVDVVEDGRTGFYVPPGDAGALRAKIDYLRENPDVGDEIGRRGRAEVLARHRTEDFVAAVRGGAS
ncbi:glycosyltransferase [Microbacterium sp. cx-55]|uniref:glycosyltransferase n=1 Tax=Microbacterium sp. cx-55 TaxID=2875948 RepID=UPI001CBE645F|nr:glycosyltransferase [Microbacterium sp. cx-55]MBZ4486905.1 glycosyltransferase [Microbacterium sp. cx-55]UGB35828.1 glycosyltransferase [Microbacterium sp. cx-55]